MNKFYDSKNSEIYKINSYKNKLDLGGASIHGIFFDNNVNEYLFYVN